MKNLLILTFCLYSAGCWVVSEGIKVTGYEGQKVTIKCSHSNAGSSLKYFCGRNQCTDEDILIKNEKGQRNPTKGRFSLYDDESGTFTVTITGLKKTDTGTYWCGIDRTLMDTHTEVQLTVLDAPTTPQTLPTTAPSSTAPPLGTTVLNQGTQTTGPLPTNVTTALKRTDLVSYVAVGLAVLMLVFALTVAVVIKMYRRRSSSVEAVSCSTENPNMATTDRERTGTVELALKEPSTGIALNKYKSTNYTTSKSSMNNCIYESLTP